jgi:Tol biopolymer transport system component
MKELLLLFLGLLSIASAEDPLWMDPPRDVDMQLLDRAERLLTGGHEDQDPALSPDGRWLAWSRSMDGNRDIWLLDLEDPAAAPLRVTRHVAADYAPSFDPAGRNLLFISEREDVRGDIWQVTLFSRLGLKSNFKASRRLERSGEQAISPNWHHRRHGLAFRLWACVTSPF